ncbi:MAG: hypothetical protein ACI8RZ_002625 [Myxococcota bacterium]|jgi:hypothetical protein
MLLLTLLSAASAQDASANMGGHLKTFFVSTFPYEALSMDPTGQGVVNARLNLRLQAGVLTLDAHHTAVASALSGGAGVGFTDTGAAGAAAEVIGLSWSAWDGAAEEGVVEGNLVAEGRMDRLLLKARLPGVDLTIGRQPVSFGSGLFFTPMDLVNPFTPATIDTEYKPGVDSVRADAYFGMSQVTAVVAYVESDATLSEYLETDGALGDALAAALYGQTTLGVTDLSILLGQIHGDSVFGLGAAGGIGPVGLHGEGTATLPADDAEDPFARAVIGAMVVPIENLSLSAEGYMQTLGADDAADYLTQLSSERYLRGELWAAGRFYGALSVGYQITPLIGSSVAIIANLEDPSMLLSPGLSWSVSGNADVLAGAYVGIGERPELEGFSFVTNSEFGLYPAAGFLQMRSYF